MIIMFVRHADAKNDKLTKLGKKQLKLMTETRDSVEFSKIYCSPANRCVKTAQALQSKYKLPLEICEGLKDRELLGSTIPQTKEEKKWYNNYLNPLYSSEKPEGCKEYLTRTFMEFERMVKTHIEKDENIVIVAHSCTTYALSAFINGIKKDHDIVWSRIGNCSRLYFEVKG